MELWSSRTPETGTIEWQVERVEEQGWTGVTFTDSQSLVGDPFVAAVLGLDRFVLTGPACGADRDDARLANQLVAAEVLPAPVG